MNYDWLTSDPHFWHANVIKYCKRPFTKYVDGLPADAPEALVRQATMLDVAEMNEKMITAWNSVVKPGQKVAHLGDFALAARAVELYVPRLNGDIDLFLGNHDFPHPAHQKGRKLELRTKWTEQYLRWGFKSVQMEGRLEVPGVGNFRLFHLPYSSENDTHQDGKPRHFKERLLDDGMPLLCGHVHEKWLFRRTPKGTPQLNVGVDAPGAPWSGQFRPASIAEVMEVYIEQTRKS